MSRILLADDSPHAQRMGELILREEGYEVVTITDGATVLLRLNDVDPDLVLVDVTMPSRSGYEICEFVKTSLRHLHTRVVLLAGAGDLVDEQEARRVRADGVLNKPFEASLVLAAVKPLLDAAAAARSESPAAPKSSGPDPDRPDPDRPDPDRPDPDRPDPDRPDPDRPDPELIRAAVTIALDAALPGLIEEIAQRVLAVLEQKS